MVLLLRFVWRLNEIQLRAEEQLKKTVELQVERNGMEWCCELQNLRCILNSAGKSQQTVVLLLHVERDSSFCV